MEVQFLFSLQGDFFKIMPTLQIFATIIFFYLLIGLILQSLFDNENFWSEYPTSLYFYLFLFLCCFLAYYTLFGADTFGYIKYLVERNFLLWYKHTLLYNMLYIYNLVIYLMKPVLVMFLFYVIFDFLFIMSVPTDYDEFGHYSDPDDDEY